MRSCPASGRALSGPCCPAVQGLLCVAQLAGAALLVDEHPAAFAITPSLRGRGQHKVCPKRSAPGGSALAAALVGGGDAGGPRGG